MLIPEERYLRDTAFRTIVDMLEHLIREAKYTPTELREACILAAIHYEMTKPRSYHYDPSGQIIPRDER